MGDLPWTYKLRKRIAGIAFRVFLWLNRTTAEQYWHQIYLQEGDTKRFPECTTCGAVWDEHVCEP